MSRSRSFVAALGFCGLLVFATSGAAQTAGNEWRRFPAVARAAYVLGVIDGWILVDVAVEETKEVRVRAFKNLSECYVTRKMTGEQLGALVDKYMADHPDQWHTSMPSIVLKALAPICK